VTDRNTAFAVGLCDALARLGVEHACISPGSRSTPLALALADHDMIADWSHHDERSSAFFGLGIARTTGRPVIVVTTSGTAAAELYPAIIEARYGRVPLIAITADRPSELRDTGSPQTIDQRDLFGRMVSFAEALDADDAEPGSLVGLVAARLVSEAQGPPAGPVHLNVGFREPLLPTGEPPPPPTPLPSIEIPAATQDAAALDEAIAAVSGKKGVIIAGPQGSSSAADAATRLAFAAGWPILADPLSGLRAGTHDRSSVLRYGDALATAGWLEHAIPEVVVRFGSLPASKAVWTWLAAGTLDRYVLIEPHPWADPAGVISDLVRIDPGIGLGEMAARIEPVDDSWMSSWRAADDAAADAIASAVDSAGFPTEPAVARLLGAALPDPSVLWVASSMPIRDVDTFFGTVPRQIRILGNRGVNGIDGFVSTGLGSAAVAGKPTVIVAGDLSLLHDVGSLATAARLAIPVTIVVINNDGGGIFHFLPQEGHHHFERHFGTPHGLSFSTVAESFGVAALEIDDADHLAAALGEIPSGPRLIEVRTDRSDNLAIHHAVRDAVRKAVERAVRD
jgi:2-succinyl-5-enolpyruvyl-6-hydroxy-3-cyclohexene-1-carboxylate synthase